MANEDINIQKLYNSGTKKEKKMLESSARIGGAVGGAMGGGITGAGAGLVASMLLRKSKLKGAGLGGVIGSTVGGIDGYRGAKNDIMALRNNKYKD